MVEFVDFVLLGLGIGALYGLIALPLSLVYTTTNCIDIAVGGYAVLSGMIAASIGGPLQVIPSVLSFKVMHLWPGSGSMIEARSGPQM